MKSKNKYKAIICTLIMLFLVISLYEAYKYTKNYLNGQAIEQSVQNEPQLINTAEECIEKGFELENLNSPECFVDNKSYKVPKESIYLYSPLSNDVISRILQIKLSTDVINDLQVEIKVDQEVFKAFSISQKEMKTNGFDKGFKDITKTFGLPKMSAETGTLIVYELSPRSDILNKVEIPIKFEKLNKVESFDPLKNNQDYQVLDKVNIDVPFQPQAPYGNWGSPFDEACEEASLILVEYYLKNQSLTKEEMSAEIKQMVSWEKKNGYKVDVTVEELLTIANKYYNLDGIVYSDQNVTIENIKKLLLLGYPIIMPFEGRMFQNPYYSGLGPPYHMLVVTGFENGYFITNDIGTKRGKGYKYKENILFDAIHDWTGNVNTIKSGKKAMMVFKK